MVDTVSTSGAFSRLYKLAPNGRTLDDLAKTVVFLTGARNPFEILMKLGYNVRFGTAGGEWLILPKYSPSEMNGTVVIDKQRASDIEIAECECITAILFDHFGKIGSSIPPDVRERRMKLYKDFSKALLNALKGE